MTSIDPSQVKRLRARIKEFEDRKVSAANLSREIFHVAREVVGDDEAVLRRSLERLANRVATLVERSISENVRSEILESVDEVESELREWGY